MPSWPLKHRPGTGRDNANKTEKNISQQARLVPFLLIRFHIHMYIRLNLIRSHCCIGLYKVQFGIADISVLNVFLPSQVKEKIELTVIQYATNDKQPGEVGSIEPEALI